MTSEAIDALIVADETIKLRIYSKYIFRRGGRLVKTFLSLINASIPIPSELAHLLGLGAIGIPGPSAANFSGVVGCRRESQPPAWLPQEAHQQSGELIAEGKAVGGQAIGRSGLDHQTQGKAAGGKIRAERHDNDR